MTTPAWAILLVVFGTLLGAVGALMLKKGSKSFSLSLGAAIKNKHLIMGVVFYGAATIPFIVALRAGELSVLYPIVSVSYVWVSLLSTKYLNEGMNAWKWAGIVLIIIGSFFIGLGS